MTDYRQIYKKRSFYVSFEVPFSMLPTKLKLYYISGNGVTKNGVTVMISTIILTYFLAIVILYAMFMLRSYSYENMNDERKDEAVPIRFLHKLIHINT